MISCIVRDLIAKIFAANSMAMVLPNQTHNNQYIGPTFNKKAVLSQGNRAMPQLFFSV